MACVNNLVAQVAIECFLCHQINGASTKHLRKFLLNFMESEEIRCLTLFKFDQHIHITVVRKVITQH